MMRRYVRRVSLPVVLAAVLISLLGAAVAVAALRSPLTAPPPPPVSTPGPPSLETPQLPPSMLEGGERLPNVDEIMSVLGLSREAADVEYARLRLELVARWEVEGLITHTQGPETAGSVIGVGGRPLQLPSDVYIQSNPVLGSCASTTVCPRYPLYLLRRGDATIWVDSEGKFGIDEEIGWVKQWLPEFEAQKPEFQFLFQFLRELPAP